MRVQKREPKELRDQRYAAVSANRTRISQLERDIALSEAERENMAKKNSQIRT